MKNIRLVILESPYDSWKDPTVGNLLMALIGVKLRGYGKLYPYGVLPVDGADLISRHMSICRIESDNNLVPIMGMRWTSLKKSRQHFINFPGMGLLQQAAATEHIQELEKIILELDQKNADLFYAGSLAIDPNEKGDKEQSLFLRELLTLMFVEQHREHPGCEIVSGGTVRFKMDNWLKVTGFSPLMDKAIEVKHLAGEEVRVMHLKEFSLEAQRIAKKWKHLWDDRLIIGDQQKTDVKKVA